MVAMDFFLVPTIKLKLLWVLVILDHDRRKILHLSVMHRPSTVRVKQELRNAFPFESFPKYLIHDRDRHFQNLACSGMREIVTAPGCPWQNSYVERVIGTIRRECTDHLIVLGERHLANVLQSYKEYYNRSRPHLSLKKDSPISRPVQCDGDIISISRVGGLHHEFRRATA